MLPNPYVLIGAGVLFLSAVTGSYFTGRTHEGNARDAAQLEAQMMADKLTDDEEEAASDATADIAADTEAKRENARDVTNRLLAEVPNATSQEDRNTPISPDLVGLWLDSIRGELSGVPGSPGQPDVPTFGSQPTLGPVDVITTEITNNGKHHSCRATLIGLQEWVRRQQEISREFAAMRKAE